MAHQQKTAARSSGRTTRQASQPFRAEIATEPNILTPSPGTGLQLDIEKLSKGLGSVDLKETLGAQDVPARLAPSHRTTGINITTTNTTIKCTSKAKTAVGTSATAPQAHQEPPVVRRSRRGEKAISHHPQVGRYRVELTSSERLWCGKFALGISTAQQLGTRLTVEEFDAIFVGEESRALNDKHGWVESQGTASNFYDEQLDLVLRVWGRRRGMRLRLGVVRDFEGVFVNGGPMTEETDELKQDGDGTTVWVHNDNAMLLGRPFNHYSGISVLEKA